MFELPIRSWQLGLFAPGVCRNRDEDDSSRPQSLSLKRLCHISFHHVDVLSQPLDEKGVVQTLVETLVPNKRLDS
jgi:hypothetical protein